MTVTKVKVLGRSIPVEYIPPEELNKIADDTDILGYFCGQRQVIYINNTLPNEAITRVIYHETFHATMNITGLSYLLNDNVEEAISNAMESWIDLKLE